MLKLLNILAIAYLTIAPGMNVGSLLHAVELCRFFDAHTFDAHTSVAAPAHTCRSHSHAHDDFEHIETPAHEHCHHDHALPVESQVVPASAPHPVVDAPAVHFCCLFRAMLPPADGVSPLIKDARPPPWPSLTGTVILLV